MVGGVVDGVVVWGMGDFFLIGWVDWFNCEMWMVCCGVGVF